MAIYKKIIQGVQKSQKENYFCERWTDRQKTQADKICQFRKILKGDMQNVLTTKVFHFLSNQMSPLLSRNFLSFARTIFL